ncbi:MAG: chemotaxis protein CheW [Actinobacteria bacterium]|nr:chemotaxis protein CheW [Actinomycetota bacterium]
MTAAVEPAAPEESGGNVTAVLEQRARALARVPEQERTEEIVTVLVFTVGERRYAVDVAYVREVVADPRVSRVPWAPPAVAGVVNVRGEILTVAHLGQLLGDSTPGPGGAVVVLVGAAPPLGLLADAVDDLADLAPGALAAAAADATAPGNDLVVGITRDLLVLDANALLTDPRMNTTDRSADAGYRPSTR